MTREFVDYAFSDNDNSHYIAVLRPDVGLLPIVLEQIENSMDSHRVPPDDKVAVQILCEEILSNALFATADKNPSGQVMLHSVVNEKNTKIMVLDSGKGIDKKKLMDISDDLALVNRAKEYKDKATRIKKSGKMYKHKRFGKGLKLIHNISDILEILFYERHGGLTPYVPKHPIGTLIISTYIHKFES